jgi:thiamine-monophosphate kinase
MATRPGEFDLIGKYFRPLAKLEKGAVDLSDDGAVLAPREGHHLVVTMDTLVAGVHFLELTAPHFIAAKTLRVNLSDLAAMGAEPAWYTLSLSLPDDGANIYDADWLDAFAQSLAVEQKLYGIILIGGDTVATPGPLSLTVTALGWVQTGRELLRSGANPGDIIYVSGTIGDAMLGLTALRGGLSELQPSSQEIITERYHRPQPRLDLGAALFGLASAVIDISDGLVQDLGHICKTSEVGAILNAEEIPLSVIAQNLIKDDPELIKGLLSAGDDYELLFSVPPGRQQAIAELSDKLQLPLTPVGLITAAKEAKGVTVIDETGKQMSLPSTGYRHF